MIGTSDYLSLHARVQPSAPAIHDLTTGQRWTYQSFDRAVAQYAALLRKHGIADGDRIAVLSKNRADLIFLHLSCARIGAIYVPLNWRLSPAEIEKLIEDAEPRMLLGDKMLAQAQLDGVSLDEFALQSHGCDAHPYEPIDAEAISLILYTSGTSGRPKGVLLSERNIWETALNFSILGRVTHGSAVLCDSPMFHIIGLVTTVRSALMRGGKFIVSDGFIPERTLARLADHTLGVTHYFCVPQMAAAMRADPTFDAHKLRRLTAIFSGGAPHAADAIRAWANEGIAMADGFGMSEAGTVSCMPLDLERIASHAGSVGITPPGLQVRILNEEGNDCGPGEPGEVQLKGPSVTSGYWRRPEETQLAFSEDGWLRTGDIGRIDPDGFMWIIDRKKEMFISGGENVYPAEIEGVLAAYPYIAECAVVGVGDERWGEVGHLVVVPLPNQDLARSHIVEFLESRLARYKIPKHVSVMERLPRNAAGKIAKSELRSMITRIRRL
jgi:fatty-acyl-CoA synthase